MGKVGGDHGHIGGRGEGNRGNNRLKGAEDWTLHILANPRSRSVCTPSAADDAPRADSYWMGKSATGINGGSGLMWSVWFYIT